MPGTRVNQRVRALALARDCALLGARVRTIHHLTGVRPQELMHLLFVGGAQPPRGRAPDCPRRFKFDPPCRFKSDPGSRASHRVTGCA